jgi:hypothetical protein
MFALCYELVIAMFLLFCTCCLCFVLHRCVVLLSVCVVLGFIVVAVVVASLLWLRHPRHVRYLFLCLCVVALFLGVVVCVCFCTRMNWSL